MDRLLDGWIEWLIGTIGSGRRNGHSGGGINGGRGGRCSCDAVGSGSTRLVELSMSSGF